jgi:pyruvate dehydrogenase E1 component alpha subunit
MGVSYREDSEVLEWRERDPLTTFEERIIAMGIADRGTLDAVRERVLFEINEAVAFAESSPFPPAEALLEDVYTVAAGGPQ